jgi:hypothetical protein
MKGRLTATPSSFPYILYLKGFINDGFWCNLAGTGERFRKQS